MTLNVDEVKKLRRELERDIEALNRVEALLARRTTEHLTERAGGGTGIARASSDDLPTANLKLTPQTLDIIGQAGPSGIRASEVVRALIKRGYKFASKESGASSVSTTLKRLVKQKKIDKAGRIYTIKASA